MRDFYHFLDFLSEEKSPKMLTIPIHQQYFIRISVNITRKNSLDEEYNRAKHYKMFYKILISYNILHFIILIINIKLQNQTFFYHVKRTFLHHVIYGSTSVDVYISNLHLTFSIHPSVRSRTVWTQGHEQPAQTDFGPDPFRHRRRRPLLYH